MTKAELIAKIAEQSGLTKTAAGQALDCLFEQTATVLKKEGRFVLPGVGVFVVEQRAARTGRNPRTGESMAIAASRAVKFKAAKSLKDSVQ